MQYENVFKSDGCCSCYTCLPRTAPAARTAQKMAALGTGTGAPQMDHHLLMNTCTLGQVLWCHLIGGLRHNKQP